MSPSVAIAKYEQFATFTNARKDVSIGNERMVLYHMLQVRDCKKTTPFRTRQCAYSSGKI